MLFFIKQEHHPVENQYTTQRVCCAIGLCDNLPATSGKAAARKVEDILRIGRQRSAFTVKDIDCHKEGVLNIARGTICSLFGCTLQRHL